MIPAVPRPSKDESFNQSRCGSPERCRTLRDWVIDRQEVAAYSPSAISWDNTVSKIWRMTVVIAVLAAGSLAAPPAAIGQDATKIHRIGFINVGPAAPNEDNVEAFRAGLRDLGYVEGRTIVVDYRWADGKIDRLPGLVNELLRLKPEVIVSTGGLPTFLAVKAATTTVPVVFITGDPVEEGIVSSLARPGGNLTGFAVLAEELESKRLELLKEVIPKATRIAVVWNPAQPFADRTLNTLTSTAHRLGMTAQAWR